MLYSEALPKAKTLHKYHEQERKNGYEQVDDSCHSFRLMIHATHFMKFHALEQFHQIPSRSVIYTDEKCKFIILHLNNSTGGAPFAAEFSASLIAYRLLPGYQNQMK